jgi:hypothetical protein
MGEFEVPQTAVEAATDRVYRGQQLTAAHARAVLRVAAPHIAAAALRQAAEEHIPAGQVQRGSSGVMAEAEVPEAAVEAAVVPFCNVETGSDYGDVRAILAAAAPHIAADTLRLAAQELCRAFPSSQFAVQVGVWLRRSADDLDGYQPTPDTQEGILAAAGLTEDARTVALKSYLTSYGEGDPDGP